MARLKSYSWRSECSFVNSRIIVQKQTKSPTQLRRGTITITRILYKLKISTVLYYYDTYCYLGSTKLQSWWILGKAKKIKRHALHARRAKTTRCDHDGRPSVILVVYLKRYANFVGMDIIIIGTYSNTASIHRPYII